MFIKCLGAKFKFGFLMLSKDCKNSYKIDKVLGLIDLDVTSSLKEKEIKIGLDLSRGSVSGGARGQIDHSISETGSVVSIDYEKFVTLDPILRKSQHFDPSFWIYSGVPVEQFRCIMLTH